MSDPATPPAARRPLPAVSAPISLALESRGGWRGMGDRITERVVTIGGGTGSFTMLSELKRFATRISAIVSMADSGGSSRRLMDEFGHPLPLGDLRQAL